jgi:glycosyltransferase involved in cell wall biosynthesis
MHIIDSHEFVEMYRGDKDLRIGKILAEKYGCRYTLLVPDVSSPADNKIFGKTNYPIHLIKSLPSGLEIKLYPAKVIYFRKNNISLGGFFQFSPKYLSELFKIKGDLIFESAYTTLTPRMYMSFIKSILHRTPIIYLDVGDIPFKNGFKRFLRLFEGVCIRHASKVIVYNELGRKRFIKEYGLPPNKVAVIPKPIDIDHFNPNKTGNEFKEKYGLDGKFIVAYAGRLDRNKGAEYLLHAANCLNKKSHFADIAFLFIGGNIVSKDAEYFADLFRTYKLHNAFVTGMIPHDEMPNAYAAADILVFPDITNLPGFPTVLAEAMAMGKAMIIGIEGFDEAIPITHLETGIIVPPRSTEDIVNSILLLKNDSNLRLKIGINVRQFAEENMDWDIIAKKYYEIFSTIISL